MQSVVRGHYLQACCLLAASYKTMGSERERTSLVTLLSGLGLSEEEVQCFEEENINLQTFVLLSEYDLIELGISDRAKREAIMKIIRSFRLQGGNGEPVSRLGPLSWKDGLMVVKNSSQHLDLLCGMMRYLRSQHYIHRRKLAEADGFLDKEWSCSMALLACAAVAVSQSQCAYQELEHLKLKVAATIVDQKAGRHGKTRRLVPVLVASIVLVGVVVWKISRFPVPK